MSWFYLILSIFFEVLGTITLKYSSQTEEVFWSVLIVIFYVISFILMWFAIKKIDISVAYAIWAGLGTTLISLMGWLIFKEQITPIKLFFIACIIIGVVGLKYQH